MKCIGRECMYNKCNAGNYCNLNASFFTREGCDCVIDDEIREAFDTYQMAKQEWEGLRRDREKILRMQTDMEDINDE